MVAVIGRHMELKRSGGPGRGTASFHGEKTPSFHVYPEDKHFKCYGCGAYGDVFAFLQRLEGKEFPEVVRALAQEVGVEIPEASEEDSAEARARRKERNETVAACDAAARYWAARLQSRFGAAARAYLDAPRRVARRRGSASGWASRRRPGTTCRRGSRRRGSACPRCERPAWSSTARRARAPTTASASGSCSPSPPWTGR